MNFEKNEVFSAGLTVLNICGFDVKGLNIKEETLN